jgi:hypothetical protein
VEVKTSSLSGDELGTGYGGRVIVQSNRGSQTINVRLVVVDPPETAVSPGRLDFGALPFGERAGQALQVSNKGGGALRAVVRSMEDWLLILDPAGQPIGGAVSPTFVLKRGHSTVVNLVADSSRLPTRGQHTGAIQVEATNARTPVTTVQAVVTVDLPYLLDPADRTSVIHDRDELWRWCDAHWAKAVELLAAGWLHACAFSARPRCARKPRAASGCPTATWAWRRCCGRAARLRRSNMRPTPSTSKATWATASCPAWARSPMC